MKKCLQCRKYTKELDTRWERIRNWAFQFFHDDILDLSQNKYLQGFGDGYKKGNEDYRELVRQEQLLASERQQLEKQNLPVLDENKIVRTKRSATGEIIELKIGDEVAPLNRIKELKFEAINLKKTDLWNIFFHSVVHQAHLSMFEKSKDFDDVRNGKLMLHNLGVLENMVTMFAEMRIPEPKK